MKLPIRLIDGLAWSRRCPGAGKGAAERLSRPWDFPGDRWHGKNHRGLMRSVPRIVVTSYPKRLHATEADGRSTNDPRPGRKGKNRASAETPRGTADRMFRAAMECIRQRERYAGWSAPVHTTRSNSQRCALLSSAMRSSTKRWQPYEKHAAEPSHGDDEWRRQANAPLACGARISSPPAEQSAHDRRRAKGGVAPEAGDGVRSRGFRAPRTQAGARWFPSDLSRLRTGKSPADVRGLTSAHFRDHVLAAPQGAAFRFHELDVLTGSRIPASICVRYLTARARACASGTELPAVRRCVSYVPVGIFAGGADSAREPVIREFRGAAVGSLVRASLQVSTRRLRARIARLRLACAVDGTGSARARCGRGGRVVLPPARRRA